MSVFNRSFRRLMGAPALLLALLLACCLTANAVQAGEPASEPISIGSPGSPGSNTLTLYFIPTEPVSLKWKTPRSLLRSALFGMILNRNHPIGHVNVQIECEPLDSSTLPISILTGSSSREPGHSRDFLLKEKVGFGVLTRAWPGKFDQRADVLMSLRAKSVRRDLLGAATFHLSREACHRVAKYHELLEASAPTWHYGFAARPRHLEGSGCSAFGASFVEVAGVLDADMKRAWMQSVRIPRSLIAHPSLGEQISVGRLLTHRDSRDWAREDEPHVRLDFYDPDRMFAWVKDAWDHPEPFGAERDEELSERFTEVFGKIPLAGGGKLSHGARHRHRHPGLPRRFRAVRIDRRMAPIPQEPILLGAPDPERFKGMLEVVAP